MRLRELVRRLCDVATPTAEFCLWTCRPDPEDTTTFKDELGSMVRAGARVGADGWRHRLRSFYETRGAAYMNAAKEFVAGYKEGVAEVAENRGGGEDGGGEEGAPPRTKTWEKQ